MVFLIYSKYWSLCLSGGVPTLTAVHCALWFARRGNYAWPGWHLIHKKQRRPAHLGNHMWFRRLSLGFQEVWRWQETKPKKEAGVRSQRRGFQFMLETMQRVWRMFNRDIETDLSFNKITLAAMWQDRLKRGNLFIGPSYSSYHDSHIAGLGAW